MKLKVGQEVWVRVIVDDVNGAEADLKVMDNNGATDWIYGINIEEDIVVVKPKGISGKAYVEYDFDRGAVLNVTPFEEEPKKPEVMYKVVGYDKQGHEHIYSYYCTETMADEIVWTFGQSTVREVESLDGFMINKLMKKEI